MGVDAAFFAVKARKYYYFDRIYNVSIFDLAYNGDSRYDDSMLALINTKSCDYDNAVYVLTKNIKYWNTHLEESERGRAGWNESLLKFVEMFAGDTYFIATDHEEPSYWDIAKRDGYTQFQFPEDTPEPPKCHCPKVWCPLHITAQEAEEQRQTLQGLMKALEAVSSSLRTEDGYLEIASLDGTLRKVKFESETDLTGAPIVSKNKA